MLFSETRRSIVKQLCTVLAFQALLGYDAVFHRIHNILLHTSKKKPGGLNALTEGFRAAASLQHGEIGISKNSRSERLDRLAGHCACCSPVVAGMTRVERSGLSGFRQPTGCSFIQLFDSSALELAYQVFPRHCG